QGVGQELMKEALEEFVQRGIEKLKVAVWAGNETANRFYRRHGFELATTRQHHGLPMNIYIIDLSEQKEPD
ncbi:MAG: GNAT family N-acetyltransferase, partial [Phycisphaerae bacterium]|nr:GNAT family N-acetyltransferase [Phycisphaerae bacterium]